MNQSLDPVAQYGSAYDWCLRRRNILVEGSTDLRLFQLATRLEFKKTGVHLLGNDLAIIAAGEGEQGGVDAVNNQFFLLQNMARAFLTKNGRPFYRFVGLYDNDKAGILAIRGLKNFARNVIEYKDVFRLRPIMPSSGNLEPKLLERKFDELNADYKELDWELEDLLSSSFMDAFCDEHPNAVQKYAQKGDKIHRKLTWDGKANLHRYIKKNAMYEDVTGVIDVIRAMRYYLSLPSI